MAEHNETGEKGEDLASRYLQNKGYTVIATNWNFGKTEIDILARRENILIVAEVKTRKNNYFGEPEESVTRQKQKNLIRAANAYVRKNGLDVEVRFDIVSVILNRGQHTINHIEDAFYATL